MVVYETSVPEENRECIVYHQKPNITATCRECRGHVFCKDCAIAMHKQHCLLHTIVEWEVCYVNVYTV